MLGERAVLTAVFPIFPTVFELQLQRLLSIDLSQDVIT